MQTMKRLGAQAEDHAAAYLRGVGLQIIARNLRTPEGEIDILAREGDIVVVVEVKARRTRRFGSGVSAVDRVKRARLRAAAANMLQFAPPALQQVRFDVITFEGGALRHYRAAFS